AVQLGGCSLRAFLADLAIFDTVYLEDEDDPPVLMFSCGCRAGGHIRRPARVRLLVTAGRKSEPDKGYCEDQESLHVVSSRNARFAGAFSARLIRQRSTSTAARRTIPRMSCSQIPPTL